MKKYGQKLLAFMLATAMVAGDFIPAMAAAPTEAAEAVVAETEADPEVTAEEETKEAVSETEEQPEQEENEAAAAEQGTEAGEPAALADDVKTVTIADGTKIVLGAGESEILAQVNTTGYYYIQDPDSELWATTVTVVNKTDETNVEIVPGTPENEWMIPNAVYLEAGKLYSMSFSTATEETTLVAHQTTLPNFIDVESGSEVTVKANEWGAFRVSLKAEEALYIGLDDESQQPVTYGNIWLDDWFTPVIHANDKYWKCIQSVDYGSTIDSYIMLPPTYADQIVMFADKVEIPKEDTTEISWWGSNISVPAGQKKTIKYKPTMEDAYIISTDVNDGVTVTIDNEKESEGTSYGWIESNQQYQAFVYSRSEEENRDLGTVTAVVDNTTEEEISVWLNTPLYWVSDSLTLNRTTAIPVDASQPNKLYGYAYTAAEDGIYEIRGAETAMIWSSVYGGKQVIGEKEFALMEGESLVVLVTGASKTVGLYQLNGEVVEDEELTVDGYHVFAPTSSGEYTYDEPGPIEYYDIEMNRWVSWYSGSSMWMSEGQAYFIRGTADAEETPVLYRGDGAVKTDIEKLVITPESNQLELSWNENTESYEPATFYATVHGYNAEGLESYVDWDNVTWYLTGPDGEETEVEDASNILVSEAGTYTLSAEVRSGRKKVTAETQIVVTEGRKPYPLKDAALSIASNVDKNLTLGDIRAEIEKKLDADLEHGNVVIMDQKLNQVADTTKLKKGTTEWIAYYYLNDKSDAYAPASKASVTVTYGDLKLKQLSEPNDNILVLEDVTGSPYGKSKRVEPKYTFNGVELNGEELENLGYRIADVTGKVGNKGILSTAIENNVCVVYPEKVGTDTLSWSEVIESPYTGSQITLKGSLKLTVKGENGRAVGDITISLPDGNEAKIIRCLASDVKSAAAEYALTLSMKDYDGVAYNDAPVTWSTSNKSVASVVADKNGTKLVIPKGAKSGTAQITVTAKTDRQAKASFYVKVADEDIRLVDTSLFLNSNSYEYGYLELYPNLDWAETVGCENPQMDITVVNADGSLDERFEIDPDQNPMSGYVGIRYSSDAAVKAGTIKAKLNIRLHGNGAEELNVTKDIKVINKPTFPKTAVKLLNGYNTFWNNEGAYAKVQLTTGQEITFDDITAAEDSAFTIENIEQPDEDDNTVWEVTLKSKAETPKTDNAILNVQYAGYKEAATAKVKVTVKKSVPSVGVYADYAAKTVFYPELSKQMTVLVQIPDGMSEEEAVNGLGLTKAAEKVFDIVNIEAGYGDTIINGRFVDLGRTLYVTLESKNEKSGNVQFTLTPANGSGTITTKSWKITAGKVSAEKTIMYDYMTGRTATTLTLQQALVGKERVELGTSISSGALYNGSDVEIDVTAADDFTKDMLDKGLLKVQKVNSYFYVWGTKGLFEQNKNACKLTFIHTIKNSETGETVPGPKAAVVTISLKKQSQAINATATVKADSALNVVDTENLVGLGMNLKNLPQGATVVYAELAEQADREKYALVSADDYWNEEKERVDSKADVSYWYDDYECGVYLTGKDGAQLPLGKTNVKLNLGIRLTDGSIVKIPATVSLNVVQNATVTAERKTLTLYNAVVGEEYAQWINLMMRIGREEKTECISAVEVSGLEGTGIAVKVNEEEPSDVQFYIESAAQTKSYKAKLTVHVAGAGTRNGKEVTYTVPVTITVKN